MPTELIVILLIAIVLVVISGITGYKLQEKKHQTELDQANQQAQKILQQGSQTAHQQAQSIQQKTNRQTDSYKLSMTEELDSYEADNQTRANRVEQHQKMLDSTRVHLNEVADRLGQLNHELSQTKAQIKQDRDAGNQLLDTRVNMMAQTAGMSVTDAQNQILTQLSEDLEQEREVELRFRREDDEGNVNKAAKAMATDLIQRGPVDFPREHLEHSVIIADADSRRKLMDRDEQVLRYLETLTGTSLIFAPANETELQIVTGDPLRREIARLAITNLAVEHQWGPLAVEKHVNDARSEVLNDLRRTGEDVVAKLRVGWMHPDLIKILGRLKFRTSYGQNVLYHSVEVAQMAGSIAAELGLDARLARRAGLLHDIGKAIDHDIDGTHVELGVQLAELYDEDQQIINAIAAHHGDVDATSPYAALVEAGDSVSGGRPGARSESVEDYVNRLRSLEKIADQHDGVKESYAIQAGREIRIIVDPHAVNDEQVDALTKDVKDQIETELTYPGKIKVTTIRDFRATAYVGADRNKNKSKKKKRA
ncbi:ribonuclease Y [Lentilactobacillus kribbianus]|uniref:ribonuclease Y n=1 Tax=Lentilactobacillus kribbianus TaxID=2729622 RepID=UPI001552EA8A|nr:ribonuclease Y [Lentilactobacillus kribbianus]